MVSSDGGRLILLDITENVDRQIDLAWLSVIILLVMIGLSYGISRWFVSAGLKDLYKLSDGVASSHIDNLRKKLSMNHLPADDEINIVADAIDEMKEKIHTQVQSIKDFVSHVSHEFKTPLMVLRSDIELAQKTKDYEKVTQRNIQTVEQMQSLLDGLLILTATQAGKFEMTDVNMSELSQRVADMMIKKYTDKDIILHIDIAKNIHITAHPSAAESIISNILDNAYKYTPEGGEITLSLTEDDLTISDTGIGIPADLQEKIRQPFWQADKNRQDGVGLGLAIVKKLGDVLGWKIKIENNDVA